MTLTRANLPAVAAGRRTSAAMVAGDLLDGRLARHRAEVTVFGSYADSVADGAFWTWFAARHGPSRLLRGAALIAWPAPSAAAVAGLLTARAIQHHANEEDSDER